jgi:hypothetical protein
LLADLAAALLTTQRLIAERTRAADAGLIDDVDFLEKDIDFDKAFAERQQARDAYLQHRWERHAQFL